MITLFYNAFFIWILLFEKQVYPPQELVFSVFEIYVKIILLEQDPYHGSNQANELSFSVILKKWISWTQL